MVDAIDAIEHPVVRTLFRQFGWDEPTDLSIQADLPASAGLGSSSAFTVSLINLLSHMKNIPRTRMELAREAIYVEQVLLKENVGVQDQLHTCFGGINRFDLREDHYRITPLNISGEALCVMTNWMVLVYTGIKRRATDIVEEQVRNTASKALDSSLAHMMHLVDAAQAILEDIVHPERVPEGIARLLDESWQIKKSLSSGITKSAIDDLYDHCLKHGAWGGKLCGAGGGGFLLMVVPPEKRKSFQEAIGAQRCIDFKIDFNGTTLLRYGQ
jgi:D-glycero-alpha-D-manno-heptose-7-phosphate kinase